MGKIFDEMKNTAVVTTQEILDGGSPVLFVTHDREDGMWQFLSGDEARIGEARLVALSEVLAIDVSLQLLEDLPIGWKATRQSVEDEWVRSESV